MFVTFTKVAVLRFCDQGAFSWPLDVNASSPGSAQWSTDRPWLREALALQPVCSRGAFSCALVLFCSCWIFEGLRALGK